MSILEEAGVKLISVVITELNGDQAKLLTLTNEQYEKLLFATVRNVRNVEGEILTPNYALFVDTDLGHNLNFKGNSGALTKSQFDEILKDIYNAKLQYDKNGNPLKDSE